MTIPPNPTRPDSARPAEGAGATAEADALHCPGCGYNLRGVCTRESPEGRCPECGIGFRRESLLERMRERDAYPMGLAVLQLLMIPVLLACLPMCCGVSSLVSLNRYDQFGSPLFILGLIAVPILGAALAAWLVSAQVYPGMVSGIAPEHRRGLQRSAGLLWFLFFVIEAVLTAVYLFGGCAVIFGAF